MFHLMLLYVGTVKVGEFTYIGAGAIVKKYSSERRLCYSRRCSSIKEYEKEGVYVGMPARMR